MSSCRGAAACAPEYASSASALADARGDVSTDVLYVVGGLYGNGAALTTLAAALRKEAATLASCGGTLAVCFNGDFNFLNASEAAWVDVNARVRGFGAAAGIASVATAGNVEHEVARDFRTVVEAAGCGCAYPEAVDAAFAARAGEIVRRLRRSARRAHASEPWIVDWLETLPFTATFSVGGSRVAAIHGDPDCVNGWGLAADGFTSDGAAARASGVDAWFAAAGADVFAAAHTCLPFLQRFEGGGVVANNGAAGLGNFAGESHGVATRVAVPGAPPSALGDALYGTALATGATVDAVPVRFPIGAHLRDFDALWPAGSPAALSYRTRLKAGVDGWTVGDARRVAT